MSKIAESKRAVPGGAETARARAHIVPTAGADEMVILSRAEYDALFAAAGDEEAEGRAADRISRAGRDAIARDELVLLPDWLAFATARGEAPVKVVRRHRGLTQTEVARAAGITQGFLSDLERGAKRPNAAMRTRLAVAMSVDPNWLEPV